MQIHDKYVSVIESENWPSEDHLFKERNSKVLIKKTDDKGEARNSSSKSSSHSREISFWSDSIKGSIKSS